jgi:hypothetical protein
MIQHNSPLQMSYTETCNALLRKIALHKVFVAGWHRAVEGAYLATIVLHDSPAHAKAMQHFRRCNARYLKAQWQLSCCSRDYAKLIGVIV